MNSFYNTLSIYIISFLCFVFFSDQALHAQLSFTDISVSPGGATTITVADDGTIYVGKNTELFRSTDGGASYELVYTVASNAKVRNIFITGDEIYLGTTRGLYISKDGGTSFVHRSFEDGIGERSVTGVHVVGDNVYLSLHHFQTPGFAKSTDGGVTFTSYYSNIGFGHNSVNAIFVKDGVIYLATQNGVSISTNGGTSFTNHTTGLGHQYVFDVFVDDGGTIYVPTFQGLGISTNGGQSFTNYGFKYYWKMAVVGSTVYLVGVHGLDVFNVDEATFTTYIAYNSELEPDFIFGVDASEDAVYVAQSKIFAALNMKGETEFCDDESTVLGVNYPAGTNTYNWSNGATTWSISPDASGEYSVSVTNNGKQFVASANVTKHEVPSVSIELNGETCPDKMLEFETTGSDVIEWNWTGPDNFYSSKATPSISNLSPDNSGTYHVSVMNAGNCFSTAEIDISIPEPFEVDTENATHTVTATNLNVYSVEMCGGVLPFDFDFSSEGGYASTNILPAGGAGCQTLQITYANGVSWDVEFPDQCGEKSISSVDLPSNVVIDSYTVTPESCPGTADGAVTASVSGGDTDCGTYTFSWSGPNAFSSSSNPITGLASGTYTLTATDCEGNGTVGSVIVSRNSGGGRGGRGRGGCKTGIESFISEMQVQPNPASNVITLNYDMEEGQPLEVTIMDLAGRTVRQQAADNHLRTIIDVASLQNGLYIVTLSENSKLKGRAKLMVAK